MTDDELTTLVRAQRDQVPLTIPVEEIINRGQAVRTWRLIPAAAAVLAVAGGTALAVSGLTPAGHPVTTHAPRAGHQTTARLAAWTVTKLAGGNISVSVRQLQDPAELQSTLRADGVPASVTFAQQLNPACEPYPGGGTPGSRGYSTPSPLLKAVFPQPYQDLPARGAPSMTPAAGPPPTPPPPSPTSTVVVIDTSALPSNAGVQLATSSSGTAFLTPQLVFASAQCTGS